MAVRSRYMKSSQDQEASLHRLMAGYFLQLVDPKRDESYTGNSVRAFSELPFHLVWRALSCKIRLKKIHLHRKGKRM